MEVGDTWNLYRVDNLPRQLATYHAMQAICAKVLDLAHDKFGCVELTYAFASPELDKLVRKNPNPNTTRNGDQHAGCELDSSGKPFCSRLGLGVDFRCPDISSAEVAKWVAENTEFDRIYFYSEDRPFHVSVGPDNERQITWMQQVSPERLMPRRISVVYFDELLSRSQTD
jgi:hypothetical protein